MQIDDFIKFYRDSYLPIYSDLVGYLGDKPRQVLIEMENILSHTICFLGEKDNEIQRVKNLEKAYNHLIRATIDCYKILWVAIKDDFLDLIEISEILTSEGVSREQLYVKKLEFKELSMAARRTEMSSIGSDHSACIKAYEDVIYFGWDIIKTAKKQLILKLEAPITSIGLTGEIPPESFISPNSRLGRADNLEEGIKELDS